MKKAALTVLVFGMLAFGCSTMEVEDYDQSCTTADDCIVQLVGDVCGCGCEYGAFAKSDLPKYQSDYADAYDYCVGFASCDACNMPNPPACTAGKCTVVP